MLCRYQTLYIGVWDGGRGLQPPRNFSTLKNRAENWEKFGQTWILTEYPHFVTKCPKFCLKLPETEFCALRAHWLFSLIFRVYGLRWNSGNSWKFGEKLSQPPKLWGAPTPMASSTFRVVWPIDFEKLDVHLDLRVRCRAISKLGTK